MTQLWFTGKVNEQMRYALSLLWAFLCWAGCSTQSAFVGEEYREEMIPGRSLAIATVMPTLLNPEDVTANLGDGAPMSVFLKFFSDGFVKAIHKSSTFSDVVFSTQNSSVPLHWQSTTLENGAHIRLMLPPENSTVVFDSVRTDFVLFIGRFTIRRNDPVPAYDVGKGVTGGSSGSLSHTVDYAIWDNARGKVVTYGRVIAETQVSVFKLTRWNWESCVTRLADRIMADTPFRKN